MTTIAIIAAVSIAYILVGAVVHGIIVGTKYKRLAVPFAVLWAVVPVILLLSGNLSSISRSVQARLAPPPPPPEPPPPPPPEDPKLYVCEPWTRCHHRQLAEGHALRFKLAGRAHGMDDDLAIEVVPMLPRQKLEQGMIVMCFANGLEQLGEVESVHRTGAVVRIRLHDGEMAAISRNHVYGKIKKDPPKLV